MEITNRHAAEKTWDMDDMDLHAHVAAVFPRQKRNSGVDEQ
jgi:hypothetical protein